ncbi:MAG TPA: hypothetical protein VFD73_27460, partial [Gemmatimonadales bacterium]|nr:hypothetical protein [Gemmatimonadales bacterium]
MKTRLLASLPALALVFVVAIACVLAPLLPVCGTLIEAGGGCNKPILPDLSLSTRSLDELAARYVWGLSALAVFTVSLIGGIPAAVICLTGARAKWGLGLIALAAVTVLLLKAKLPSFAELVFSTLFLHPTVYKQIPHVETVGAAVDVTGACFIVIVTMAVCKLLASVVDSGRTAPAEPAQVAAVIRALRTLLFSSSIVLIAGVVEVTALYGWGGAILNATIAEQKLTTSPSSSNAVHTNPPSGAAVESSYQAMAKSVPGAMGGI